MILTLCYFPPGFDLLHVRRSRWEQMKRIDFGGLLLFTAGLLLFIMGLSLGGNLYSWRSAKVLSMIIVGALALIAFVFYGTRHLFSRIEISANMTRNMVSWRPNSTNSPVRPSTSLSCWSTDNFLRFKADGFVPMV